MENKVAILMIVILLIGSLAFTAPIFADIMRDYSKHEGWLTSVDESNKPISGPDYVGDSGEDHLDNLYDLIGTPIRPSRTHLLVISFLIGIAFLIYSMRERGLNEDWLRLIVFPTQAICVLLMAIAVAVGYMHFDIAEKLSQHPDKLLCYFAHQICIIFLAIVLLIIADLFFCAIELIIWEVVSLARKCKKFIFARMLSETTLKPNEESIIIDKDGIARLVKINLDGPTSYVEVRGKANLPTFFGYMLGDGNSTFGEFKQLLIEVYQAQFALAGEATIQEVVNSMGSTVQAASDRFIESWSKRRRGQSEIVTFKTASGLLQTVSDDTLAKYRSEIAAELVGFHAGQMHQAYTKLGSKVQQIAQSTNDIEELLPQGTVFSINSGGTSVYVIEQRPQTRTIFFEDRLMRSYTDKKNNPRERKVFHLSFPYAIFLVALYSQGNIELQALSSKKPLKSLDEQLSLLCLPNISSGSGFVCLGTGFKDLVGTQRERVEHVIDYFWSSRFNDDIEDNFNSFFNSNSGLNLVEWERQSARDPMAALSLNHPSSTKTLREMIGHNLRYSSSNVIAREVKALLDECQQEAQSTVECVLNELNIDERYTNAIVRQFTQQLKALSVKIINDIKTDLDELSDKKKLENLINYQANQVISEILSNSFEEITSRVVVRPDPRPQHLFDKMRRSQW